jgi:hypothetical protein
LYGRQPVYTVAMGLFLMGSLLCGTAQSMPQLRGSPETNFGSRHDKREAQS